MADEEKNGGPIYLREWRSRRGMTQTALGEKVGTSAAMIWYLERGHRGITVKWLRRLAAALRVSPTALLEHDPSVGSKAQKQDAALTQRAAHLISASRESAEWGDLLTAWVALSPEDRDLALKLVEVLARRSNTGV
ncbi:helix-turn-helix domain-containing protein [Novosphingobium tardum]|uniref:Helix-turn-helix domain-containing protein n=1 Tax=Novosphingobium tardum TaxID=1538021 RepID=A0ABV8RTH9_9SPHN